MIYALADYGLVVSADHRKGGTWGGAEEELNRRPHRPVFVRVTGAVPPGNRALVKLGAIAFPGIEGHEDPAARLEQAAAIHATPAQEGTLPLFC